MVYGEYVDDGISGTTFERPDFKRMILDIENGNIGVVLVKDMSRLGRNNAMVAYYTEMFFPENDVRFIAVSDGIDTSNGENEIMAFKSVINEYYARDISKKIRAAYRTKALNGEFTAPHAPYGYKKNPENKRQLVPDENTMDVVKSIFHMAAEGLSPFKIGKRLSADKVLTPRAYTASQHGKYSDCFHPKYPEDWSNSSVASIIKNREYLGHLVCNVNSTKSFKSRKLVKLPESEWIVVENTHEALIDEFTFELSQKVIKVKKRENSVGIPNIFSGLLRCSDCGGKMSYIKPKSDGHKGSFNCNLFRKRNSKYCTAHYVTYDALYEIVLDDIKRIAMVAKGFENELSDVALKFATDSSNGNLKKLSKDFEKLEKRNAELDTIIRKLFEHSYCQGIFSNFLKNLSHA